MWTQKSKLSPAPPHPAPRLRPMAAAPSPEPRSGLGTQIEWSDCRGRGIRSAGCWGQWVMWTLPFCVSSRPRLMSPYTQSLFIHPVLTDPTLHARLCPGCWGHSVNNTSSGSWCSHHRTDFGGEAENPLRPAQFKGSLQQEHTGPSKPARARRTLGPWDRDWASRSQPPVLTPRANAPSTARLSVTRVLPMALPTSTGSQLCPHTVSPEVMEWTSQFRFLDKHIWRKKKGFCCASLANSV